MLISKRFVLLSFVAFITACLAGCGQGSDKAPSSTGSTPQSPTTSNSPKVAQFSETMPPAIAKLANNVIAGGKCNMETINGVGWSMESPYDANRSDTVIITGWGLDDEEKRLPESIFLRFQLGKREFYAPIETIRVPRPDLVEYTKQEYMRETGYRVNASLANLTPGEYQAMIVMTFPEKAILCAAGRIIKIR